MLFKRKPNKPAPDRRNKERQATPELDDLIAELNLPTGDTVLASLHDLTIDGSGILIPRVLIPGLNVGDSVYLSLRHKKDDWQVQSAATVKSIVPQDAHETLIGLQFGELGTLYSQLDDPMGRYFNRRNRGRTQAHELKPIEVHVSCGATKSLGKLHDISLEGLCVALPHVQALQVKPGTQLKITFKLPNSRKTIKGTALVQQISLRAGIAYLGAILSKDFDSTWPVISAYVAQRNFEETTFLEDPRDPTSGTDEKAA